MYSPPDSPAPSRSVSSHSDQARRGAASEGDGAGEREGAGVGESEGAGESESEGAGAGEGDGDGEGAGEGDGDGETSDYIEMDLDEMEEDMSPWIAEQLRPMTLPDDVAEGEVEPLGLRDPYRALTLLQQSLGRLAQPRAREMQQIEAEAAQARTEGPERSFSLLLWNDENHDFPTVIHMVARTMGRSAAEGKGVAERVDRHGREVLRTDTSVPDLLLAALKFAQIELGVSIRPAYDVFGEDVAFMLWRHLKDLCSASLFLPCAIPPPMLWRTIVTNQLMQPWQHLYPIAQPRMTSAYFNPNDLTKLDGLLVLESKLPKQARIELKDLILLCIGTKETKKQIGACPALVRAT